MAMQSDKILGKDQETWNFVNNCQTLYHISLDTCKKLINFHTNDSMDYEFPYENLVSWNTRLKEKIYTDAPLKITRYYGSLYSVLSTIVLEVEKVTKFYTQIVESSTKIHEKIYSNYEYNLQNYNYEIWMKKNRLQYDSFLHCVRIVIHKLLKFYEEITLQIAVKLISFYNCLVSLELSVDVDVVFAHSSESIIVQNKKKFTISRVLKILSSNRTEECARYLTQFLTEKFDEMSKVRSSFEAVDEEDQSVRADSDETHPESDNTSIFVFKTLTQYVSPPRSLISGNVNYELAEADQSHETNTIQLIMNERRKLTVFLTTLLTQSNDLLQKDEIVISKRSGRTKIRTPIKKKMVEIYEHTLWQNVGIVSEHMLLWWLDEALGKKNSLFSQKFNAWLKQYRHNGDLHAALQPTINSLVDCLCCYITSTSWDELFRQALISAEYQHSRHKLQDLGLGTKTGHLFSDVLYDLVFLTNSCEGSNWTVQDMENLPIAEQIPLLHRLDHSIHMVRLWALSRAKYLANSWNMEQFFRVTHVDVNASLYALSQLKLTQNITVPSDKETPHFTVCVKMRAKLMSEVNVNIDKLHEVPKQSLSILASICMITSLAYLKICFPEASYWQQPNDGQPRIASEYVDRYLDEILKPVLLASQNLTRPAQMSVTKLALEILCEAWLDHIYKYRIKFSERGAIQLLVDFAAIPIWIQEKVSVSDDIRQLLKTSEILRRCEGVGRLLLRQPGEAVIMNSERNSLQGQELQELESAETLMPPEMYVPNQEKWLELRLNKQKSSLIVCCK